jgi:hypothetical protein
VATYIKYPRGTRANLTALASASSLVPYSQYWVTDESRFIMATSTSTFVETPSLGSNSFTGNQAFTGDMTVDGNITFITGGAFFDVEGMGCLSAAPDEYSYIKFYDSDTVLRNTIWAGSKNDPSFYLDSDQVTIQNLAESKVFIGANETGVSLYYQNAVKFVTNATGVAVTGQVTVTDIAYGPGWNNSSEVPTKNAIYDKIESMQTVALVFHLNGGGAVIAAGQQFDLPSVPFACTVVGWRIISDQTGSTVVDILRSTYTNFPTMSSIAGTEKPTLLSARKNEDTALSTWTTSLAQGDVLRASVSSATTVTWVTVELLVVRT